MPGTGRSTALPPTVPEAVAHVVAEADPRVPRPVGRTGLVLIAVAPLLANADQGIVSLALTDIRRDLSMSLGDVQWVTSVYALVVGALQLLGGRLADRVGPHRLFRSGLLAFAACSAVCGAAPTGAVLIAARAAQGAAAALLVPAAMALLMVVTRGPAARARALALWAGVAGVGSVGGVVFGGLVVSELSWRWAFGLSAPVAAGAFLAARRLRLPPAVRRAPRPDFVGSALLTAALLALAYGLARLPESPGDGTAWASLTVAVLLGVVLAGQQRRSVEPLLPADVAGDRALASGAFGILLVSAAAAPVAVVVGLYLRQVDHFSAWQAGCGLLPLVGGVGLVGRASSRVLARRGPRIPRAAGGVLVVAGLLSLSRLSAHSDYLTGALPGLVLVGSGLPMIWMTCEVVALAGIDQRRAGLAAGLVQSVGQIGAALGLTLVVAVLPCAGVPADTGAGGTLSAQAPHAFLAVAALMAPVLVGAPVRARRTLRSAAADRPGRPVGRPCPRGRR
ncbi:MFS transporter [Streptacidiphilus anmyonensis]|uniref:MFS transporter n=1 Tax=Streptacidiphilus anmyonensis TaxID=405782 RepID=UPI0005A5EE3B|nr:MFS transporter [Streptacidiphilus anmyonensis]